MGVDLRAGRLDLVWFETRVGTLVSTETGIGMGLGFNVAPIELSVGVASLLGTPYLDAQRDLLDFAEPTDDGLLVYLDGRIHLTESWSIHGAGHFSGHPVLHLGLGWSP